MYIFLSLILGILVVRFFLRIAITTVVWIYNSILGAFSPATERRIRYFVSQVFRWVRFVIAVLILYLIISYLI